MRNFEFIFLSRMKKVRSFALLCSLLALYSCEEKDVFINMGEDKNVIDTTYTGPVETPQSRKVVIEEFTGASCTNCPDGHRIVKAILADHKDQVIALAYHTFNGGSIFRPVNKPDHKSKYDFRDSVATDIGISIYGGLGSIPIAGIDRAKDGSSLLITRDKWANIVNNRLPVSSPANLHLTSSYDSEKNLVILKVKVAYTQNVTTKNALTICVIENGIIDLQEFPSYLDEEYSHEHILRKVVTGRDPYGKAILDSLSTKEAGRVYEYNYSFTPADFWKLENCYLVAFLSNNESENKEIIQGAEVPLK